MFLLVTDEQATNPFQTANFEDFLNQYQNANIKVIPRGIKEINH